MCVKKLLRLILGKRILRPQYSGSRLSEVQEPHPQPPLKRGAKAFQSPPIYRGATAVLGSQCGLGVSPAAGCAKRCSGASGVVSPMSRWHGFRGIFNDFGFIQRCVYTVALIRGARRDLILCSFIKNWYYMVGM